MASLYVGTSGFSFDDWAGVIYPSGLPKPQWLIHYEQSLGFNAVEINYTYYQMPSHHTMQGLVRKTSRDFRFTIKTHRSMTHDMLQDGRLIDTTKAFEEFQEGMRPLTESGKLGCVLAQFPYTFTNTPRTRDYLLTALDRLIALPLVVEFRHTSWVQPDTYALLRDRRVGWCAVDEPALSRLMPWVPETTSPIGYVRFHGRNAAAWFGTSTAERYNYLYSDAELRDLTGRVQGMQGQVGTLCVFFNNCHAGSAARNALQFRDLLKEPTKVPGTS